MMEGDRYCSQTVSAIERSKLDMRDLLDSSSDYETHFLFETLVCFNLVVLLHDLCINSYVDTNKVKSFVFLTPKIEHNSRIGLKVGLLIVFPSINLSSMARQTTYRRLYQLMFISATKIISLFLYARFMKRNLTSINNLITLCIESIIMSQILSMFNISHSYI